MTIPTSRAEGLDHRDVDPARSWRVDRCADLAWLDGELFSTPGIQSSDTGEVHPLIRMSAAPDRAARYRPRMAVARRTVTLELDRDLVDRARRRSGHEPASDAAVVEEALGVYLGMKALADAQTASGLPEDEAERLAVEEVRAHRRERRANG